MKLAISYRCSKMKPLFKSIAMFSSGLALLACASTSGSSCEKLAKNQKGEIKKMVKRFEKSASGRHVMLLETGSGISDLCRTHFIDSKEFSDLPASASDYCDDQERGADNYCTVYSVDGEYSGNSVRR